MEAVETVKSAARSALNVKNILAAVFTLILICIALDFFGVGGWVFTPITQYRMWRDSRSKVGAGNKTS